MDGCPYNARLAFVVDIGMTLKGEGEIRRDAPITDFALSAVAFLVLPTHTSRKTTQRISRKAQWPKENSYDNGKGIRLETPKLVYSA